MNDAFTAADLFGDLERLQRQMSSLFDGFPGSLRSGRPGMFPQVNIGSTDDTVEIVAFAPGLDASKLDVSIDKGLLTIAGERTAREGELPEGARIRAGAFQRPVPPRDRTAAASRSRQCAGALRRRLPADFGRQARGIEAARHHGSMTGNER